MEGDHGIPPLGICAFVNYDVRAAMTTCMRPTVRSDDRSHRASCLMERHSLLSRSKVAARSRSSHQIRSLPAERNSGREAMIHARAAPSGHRVSRMVELKSYLLGPDYRQVIREVNEACRNTSALRTRVSRVACRECGDARAACVCVLLSSRARHSDLAFAHTWRAYRLKWSVCSEI